MPVIDASIAVSWVVEQSASSAARALLAAPPQTYTAPALILVETHYVTASLARRGLATSAQMSDAIPLIVETTEIVPLDEQLAAVSGRMSLAALHMGLPHPFNIYDCAYIALAARRADTLITADHGQALFADRLGVSVHRL